MKITKKIILFIVVLALATLYSYGIWPRAIYNTDIGSGAYEISDLLKEDTSVEQYFTCKDKGLCGISIRISKSGNPVIGTYDWTLTDAESGKKIASGVIDEAATNNKYFNSSSPQKKEIVKIDFPKQNESKGREYLFTIKGSDIKEDESMSVYMTEKGNIDSKLSINGEQKNKASIVKLQYKRFNLETFIVFWVIMGYLFVFIKFMNKLFR